jgi:glutamyl-tRNA reductase
MEKTENKLYVTGISYKTSSVEDREVLEIGRKEINLALNSIAENKSVKEALIVSTCNRLEFYLLLNSPVSPGLIIKDFFRNFKSLDISDKLHLFYTYSEEEATRHLFRVVSGLDSLVLGEYQIQGQIKEAYSLACSAKTMEKYFHKLFHAAFRVGKKVRSTTSIGEGKQSVGGVSTQLIVDNLKSNESVALIGVNENTRIVANKLKYHNFNHLKFVNRTLSKAEQMVEEFGGLAYSLDDLEEALGKSKAVYSSTGADVFIIDSKMLNSLAERNCCPQILIDMAIPRDIENKNLPENIKYYDIGDLQRYLELQKNSQLEAVPYAERIIEEEVDIFKAWTEVQTESLIEPYAEKFELIRQQLLNEYREQFPDQSFEIVDKMTRKLIHRMQSSFVNALMKNLKG